MLSLNSTFSLFLVRPFKLNHDYNARIDIAANDNARLDISANGFWEESLRGHTLMSEVLTPVHPQINFTILHIGITIGKRDMNANNE